MMTAENVCEGPKEFRRLQSPSIIFQKEKKIYFQEAEEKVI
jgi:hypothetical protein